MAARWQQQAIGPLYRGLVRLSGDRCGVQAGGAGVLRRRLLALAFVDEFAPLYALFTLWFNDNAVSTSALSGAFILWATLAVVLEVPSGALADRVDRRAVLAAAFALRAAGIAVWLIWPSVTGLVIGAVLWAVHDASASGAWEAMIHDQLEAVGAESTYGVVIARVGQFTHLGLAAGTVAASSLIGLGVGIAAIGWVNVVVHGLAIVLVIALPDVRWVVNRAAHDDGGSPGDDDPDSSTSWAAWWATLRAGVSTARHEPQLLRLITVGAFIGGLFIVDEYVPLLARERGAADAIVPLIVLAVWVGLIIGGEVAARRPALASTTLATGLLAGTAAMAIAIAIDSPWALLAVGLGYGTVETTWVVSDARFQARTPTATRATVTSVRSLGASLVTGAAFVVIAVLADGDDPTPGLHWVIGVLALVAFLVWRWVPDRAADPRQR